MNPDPPQKIEPQKQNFKIAYVQPIESCKSVLVSLILFNSFPFCSIPFNSHDSYLLSTFICSDIPLVGILSTEEKTYLGVVVQVKAKHGDVEAKPVSTADSSGEMTRPTAKPLFIIIRRQKFPAS